MLKMVKRSKSPPQPHRMPNGESGEVMKNFHLSMLADLASKQTEKLEGRTECFVPPPPPYATKAATKTNGQQPSVLAMRKMLHSTRPTKRPRTESTESPGQKLLEATRPKAKAQKDVIADSSSDTSVEDENSEDPDVLAPLERASTEIRNALACVEELVKRANTEAPLMKSQQNRCDVVFVGRTGVGKSTLMNGLLGKKGGAHIASVSGNNISKGLEFQVSEKMPGYRFADTPGFEDPRVAGEVAREVTKALKSAWEAKRTMKIVFVTRTDDEFIESSVSNVMKSIRLPDGQTCDKLKNSYAVVINKETVPGYMKESFKSNGGSDNLAKHFRRPVAEFETDQIMLMPRIEELEVGDGVDISRKGFGLKLEDKPFLDFIRSFPGIVEPILQKSAKCASNVAVDVAKLRELLAQTLQVQANFPRANFPIECN